LILPRPPCSCPSPYTPLFRSVLDGLLDDLHVLPPSLAALTVRAAARGEMMVDMIDRSSSTRSAVVATAAGDVQGVVVDGVSIFRDRKSTRLNSSHVKISYAVF